MSVNLLPYTELDPNGRFVVTAPKVVYTGLQRNETARVVYDYGVDFFDDVVHQGRTMLASRSNGSFWGEHMLANTINDMNSMQIADEKFVTLAWNTPAGSQQLVIREYDGGINQSPISVNLSLGINYYWRFVISETVCSLKIYDDEDRTNLLDTLPLTLTAGVSYSKHYAINSYNNGDALPVTGEIGDFDLGLAANNGKYFFFFEED